MTTTTTTILQAKADWLNAATSEPYKPHVNKARAFIKANMDYIRARKLVEANEPAPPQTLFGFTIGE